MSLVVGGMTVGNMFINSETVITLTGVARYTETFSDMAGKVNDCWTDLAGTNMLGNTLGKKSGGDKYK